MPWKELEPPTPDEQRLVASSRRAKLYADEDIEDDVVDLLRENGVNITSARELGHRGKDDKFQAAYAKKTRRYLLTKNGKDFWPDSKLPWHKVHGLIVIEGDMSDEDSYLAAIVDLLHSIVPFGDWYEGTKIRLSASGAIVKLRTWDGRVATSRYKHEGGRTYEWVEQ